MLTPKEPHPIQLPSHSRAPSLASLPGLRIVLVSLLEKALKVGLGPAGSQAGMGQLLSPRCPPDWLRTSGTNGNHQATKSRAAATVLASPGMPAHDPSEPRPVLTRKGSLVRAQQRPQMFSQVRGHMAPGPTGRRRPLSRLRASGVPVRLVRHPRAAVRAAVVPRSLPRRSHLGPPAAGHRSRAYRSAGAESGLAVRGLPSGTRAGCGADGRVPPRVVVDPGPHRSRRRSPSLRSLGRWRTRARSPRGVGGTASPPS